MHHELEMALKRITLLMETGYLPRNMMADLQTIMNAAMAWEILDREITEKVGIPPAFKR